MEIIQPANTDEILNEAIAVAGKWETPLGKGGQGKARQAFAALKQGKIELGSPQAYLHRLRRQEFAAHNVPLSPEIERSLSGPAGYHYYVLPVPVLLFPYRGAQYRLLESQLEFKLESGRRPLAIQNIFPEPFWKPVLDWGGQLNLALDGSLNWGAEVEQTAVKLDKLSAQLQAVVKNASQLAGFIKVIPFDHTLGRMEIEAQHASTTAMWRFDSRQVIRARRQVQLITLLRVPKEVEQIRIEAAAQAEPDFDWLAAQVTHVFERLPVVIKQIIDRRRGLPLQDFQIWQIDLH